jgi:hypothetical protein
VIPISAVIVNMMPPLRRAWRRDAVTRPRQVLLC